MTSQNVTDFVTDATEQRLLEHIQANLEWEMKSEGEAAYRAALNEAQGQNEGSTGYGQRLISGALEATAEEIERRIKKALSGRPGRKIEAAVGIFSDVSTCPDVSSGQYKHA